MHNSKHANTRPVFVKLMKFYPLNTFPNECIQTTLITQSQFSLVVTRRIAKIKFEKYAPRNATPNFYSHKHLKIKGVKMK